MHTQRECACEGGEHGSNCRSVSYLFLFLPVVASFDFDHDVDFNHDYGSYAYSEMGTAVRELCFGE